MIPQNRTLKLRLLSLREGEVLTITTRDLANYHNGGSIKIPARAPSATSSPYLLLDTCEKKSALVKAFQELRDLSVRPPPGVFAEELPGREFRIRFVRIEGGGI